MFVSVYGTLLSKNRVIVSKEMLYNTVFYEIKHGCGYGYFCPLDGFQNIGGNSIYE